jgi:hypothetical protein
MSKVVVADLIVLSKPVQVRQVAGMASSALLHARDGVTASV